MKRRGVVRYLQDQILAAIQKRCEHPDEMVVSDLVDTCSMDTEVSHCRRCGAVRIGWKKPTGKTIWRDWNVPTPNLWWKGYP